MNLNPTTEEEEFRTRVRTWLTENAPSSLGIGPREGRESDWLERAKAWQRKLYEAGYVALAWPKEYGGQGLDPMRQAIINEEMARLRAPGLVGAQGLVGAEGITILGPTLITWGTEAQKRYHLPRILNADEIWCQGYSEPEAGSDLAALRTRAEIVGDEFVVNGHKIWTSRAHYADLMYCLARTDPQAPKHRGISYLLIDMHAPGITVRPLVQMSGDRDFNEVFFDNVRVPLQNVVGKLHDGWRVANTTLVHERNLVGASHSTQQLFDRLLQLARGRARRGQPLTREPQVRQRLADLQISVEAMRLHYLRQLSDQIAGRPHGVETMINKLAGSWLTHGLSKLGRDLLGDYGDLSRADESAPDRGYWPLQLMRSMAFLIAGGTTEIQKNIIAQRGLKMPRER